jgi:hypothetical protein
MGSFFRSRTNQIILGVVAVSLVACCAIGGFFALRLWNDPNVQAGLQQTSADFSAMQELYQKLLQVYPAQAIQVQTFNGNTLRIQLVNSNLSELEEAAQQTQVREIAIFVKQNYTSIDHISAIVIVLTRQSQVGIFSSSQSQSYNFPVNELP